MSRYVGALTAALALGLVSVQARAQAQTHAPAAAEALFEQGRSAMKQGDYETACSKFRQSEQLDPEPGTLLNLALCEETRGRVATAWELYHAALDKLPPGDARIAVAKQHADALDKRLPKLTVRVAPGAPANTTVERDGVKLDNASLGAALPIDPGQHAIVVKAPGHAPRTFHVTLAEGQSQTLEVAPAVAQAGGGSAGGESSGGESAGSSSKTLGYAFGGVGIAGILIGTVTGAIALSKKSTVDANCNQTTKLCNAAGASAASSGRTLGPITTVSLLVGVAGLGAGAYFLFFDHSDHGSETALVANVQATGPSVSLVHRW